MDHARRDWMAKALGSGLLLGGVTGLNAGPLPALAKPGANEAAGASCRLLSDLDPEVTRRFAASLTGNTIAPGDADYAAARLVWNAAYDKRPGLIVRCADATDVVRTLAFARQHDLLTVVRGGGHSLAGKSTCEGGLVVDLSLLRRIEVDPAARLVRAQGGSLLGEFDVATAAHGLATTTGTDPSTGIAGLTLGGGLGWLMGKHGLSCDNLRSVEIVLADGRILQASDATNAELFWAVRGAGANFGVVTAFEYRLHPVETVLAGVIKYPYERLGEVLRHYRSFSEAMPDEVGLSVGTLPSRQGPPMTTLAVSYCGDLAEGERVLRPLRTLVPALSDDIKPVPYQAFQRRGGMPPGLRLNSTVRSSMLTQLGDAAIDAIVEQCGQVPPMGGNFVIERIHGQVCRTPATATAFPHRTPGHNLSIHGTWIQPSDKDASIQWSLKFWSTMQAFIGSAVYSNYLDNEGNERARAAYGVNYSRLVALKRVYDPENFFSVNQNIAHVT